MSIYAYSIAVRDYLRSNLTNFYGGDATFINRNCKVMLDEQPTADCGQEFISIYGSYHQPHTKNLMQALDEEFGLTIAVSRKIAIVPPDYRGEMGYISDKALPLNVTPADEDNWILSWASTESRCREIVKLLAGSARYSIMQNANDTLNEGSPFTEPLIWHGTDAAPRPVGPEHFYSFASMPKDADPTFGLLMKVHFGGAVRMQPIADLDYST